MIFALACQHHSPVHCHGPDEGERQAGGEARGGAAAHRSRGAA